MTRRGREEAGRLNKANKESVEGARRKEDTKQAKQGKMKQRDERWKIRTYEEIVRVGAEYSNLEEVHDIPKLPVYASTDLSARAVKVSRRHDAGLRGGCRR